MPRLSHWVKYQTHFAVRGQGGSRNASVALVQFWATLRDYGMDPFATRCNSPECSWGAPTRWT